MAVQGIFKRNREGKYLDGSEENEKCKKKVFEIKKKRYKLRREEIDVTKELQILRLLLRRHYISKYVLTQSRTITIITIKRRWHILINKFYLRSYYPLGASGFFSNALSPLMLCEFFKLCSRKLWLFLEFDCIKIYNGNRKIRKSNFWKKIQIPLSKLVNPSLGEIMIRV